MHWSEPATAEDSHAELEKRLRGAANQMWTNAALKPSEFSPIALRLIFLRYAETRFEAVADEIQLKKNSRRKIGPADYHAKGVLYLPEEVRFAHLSLAMLMIHLFNRLEADNRLLGSLREYLEETFFVLERWRG